jgi:hypothetical protein
MIDMRSCVREEMAQTKPIILEFPWEDPQAYALWLAQTYHMVNHSTRLVALAGALTPLDKNDLHARFVDHSKEERGHQLLCISDLKAMGRTLEEFPCLFPSAAMYQVQYYWIQLRGPISFFGYTLSLECLAENFGAELYRRVSTTHGANAAKFLKVHSEADIEHTEKAFQQIQKLSQVELELVKENLHISADLYRATLLEVRRSLQLHSLKRTA